MDLDIVEMVFVIMMKVLQVVQVIARVAVVGQHVPVWVENVAVQANHVLGGGILI